ncbi:hypothetical protein EG240_06110 [Paenimyroides tangerinum]|uniref:Uncharacterized protein n=1 Tax=Paenimyroides tangerinum TaxID=2488728 RepID=A0A3P3W966_9FLAO|nr:outer membrane beta-barrel protein [Paenimyroides tangerinum]RRJ91244.1 hypothetical protein EG240_06110 [Paenimyroides tangerinum]
MKNSSITLSPYNFLKKNLGKIALTAFILGSSLESNAQVNHKEERFISDSRWKLGLSMNSVNVNFDKNDPLKTSDFSTMAIPSKVTLGYEFVENLSVEAAFSFNKLKPGGFTNGVPLYTNKDIYTFSGSLLYSLGGLFNIPVVDPYLKGGIGYLSFGQRNYTTGDFGGGINFWLADFGFMKGYRYPAEAWYKRFGINVEALAKKNITNSTALGSHVQFSAGIFYAF